MALSTFPYLTANGDLRNRSVDGSGTVLDPDVAIVKDPNTELLLAKLPTLGQKAISGSVSVTPAANASILVTPVSYLGYVRLANSSGANIKNTAGSILSFVATNLNVSIRYIHLFDKSSSPIPGEAPTLMYPLFGSNLLIIDTAIWGLAGVSFSNGISWGCSTTPLTYTPSSGSDVIFEMRYL